MKRATGLSFDTLAIHAGQPPDPLTGAVMQPIVLASTFAQSGPGKHRGFEYSRSANPTRRALERCLAALEGGGEGFALSSGCGAMAVLLHTLRPGDHVLCGNDLYGGTVRLLGIWQRLGVEVTATDTTDPNAVRAAVRRSTRLIWIETPSNPMLTISDIRAIAKIAAKTKARVAVDNTFATPLLQRPLDLGATVVVHSTTKYLNGHSDVVGGALVTRDAALARELRFLQNALGAVPGPFDCYLVLRGLKTLGVRMRRQVATAKALTMRLLAHAAVLRVHYPGLRRHPGFAIAAKQMAAPGAMVSFEIAGSIENARAFLASLSLISCAESLGGVESLAEHPATMTHGALPPETRARLGMTDGLIRLSVGLESETDLWQDLERGFLAAGRARPRTAFAKRQGSGYKGKKRRKGAT